MQNDSIFNLTDKTGYTSPFGNWINEQKIKSEQQRINNVENILDDARLSTQTFTPTPINERSYIVTQNYGYQNFIDILESVENKLISVDSSKYDKIDNRIHIIRGVFYGTEWSVDYKSEESLVRNFAFQSYTSSIKPDDIRPIIGEALYGKLFNCFEVYKDSRKQSGIDFGHCIIGLDARRNFIARNTAVPLHGGATGLEISTWVGDIGGGAGMLALKRLRDPNKRAIDLFKGSSFGGWINIEGDVAAYLIGRKDNGLSDSLALDLDDTNYIHKEVGDYLLMNNDLFNKRALLFLKSLGAEFDDDYNIINFKEFVLPVVNKIFGFAELYMVNRFRQNNNASTENLLNASAYLVGCSIEMTTIFIEILQKAVKSKTPRLEAKGVGPNPRAKGKPFNKYIISKRLENFKDDAQELGKKLIDDLENIYDEIKRGF